MVNTWLTHGCHVLLNARLTLDPKMDQWGISASSAKVHGLSTSRYVWVGFGQYIKDLDVNFG